MGPGSRVGIRRGRCGRTSTALLLVRGAQVVGFRAFDPERDARLPDLEIPLPTPRIFTHPAMTRMPFRGDPPKNGIDARLIEALGRGGQPG
jgi:hypothetical protein